MLGYLEFEVKGDAKAYIEPNSIRMFLTCPGADAGTVAVPESPIKLVLANGGELEVYGTSVAEVMLRISSLRDHLKKGDAYGSFECGISFADGGMSGVSKSLSSGPVTPDGRPA